MPRSTPDARLPAALSWERLLLDKAVAAGSTPALVYNTKRSGSPGSPDAAAVAAAVPRLAAVLNPGGAIASTQLELAREEVSDPLAAFLQAVAAQARQHDVPRSLPEQYLSGASLGGRALSWRGAAARWLLAAGLWTAWPAGQRRGLAAPNPRSILTSIRTSTPPPPPTLPAHPSTPPRSRRHGVPQHPHGRRDAHHAPAAPPGEHGARGGGAACGGPGVGRSLLGSLSPPPSHSLKSAV